MRLLTLTADYCGGSTWSGIGVAVAHQAAALASLGCEVHVISPAVATHGAVNGGPQFHTLNRNHFPLPVRRTDIVHLHSLSLSGLACEMRRRFGCRLIYTAHTLPARELPDTLAGQYWSHRQDWLFECADHVFFLNPDDRAEGEARVPGLSRRSSLLPHSIPAPQVAARITTNGNVAAFVGRFTRGKGIDIAASTVAGLIDRGTDWKVCICRWARRSRGRSDGS
jgi:glycosyltransferase involved in cell wall biosynthesis